MLKGKLARPGPIPDQLCLFNKQNMIFVYRKGRLCGGAHEISGIKAPLFLHGGWWEGSLGGWVVVGWVVGWVVVGWVMEWVVGWVGGGGMGHGMGGCVVVGWIMGWVGDVGSGGVVGPNDTPIMGGIRCPHVNF